MSSNSNDQGLFETFNARHLTAGEVARGFVDPGPHYSRLITNNNHLLVGPRGSGKTTLLKMLTLPAIAEHQFRVQQRGSTIEIPKFFGVFVPADRSWQVQLRGTVKATDEGSEDNPSEQIGRSTFVTHVQLSVINTIEDLKRLCYRKNLPQVTADLPEFTSTREAEVVREIAKFWKVSPEIDSFIGLKAALRQRIVTFGELREARYLDSKEIDKATRNSSAINELVIAAIQTVNDWLGVADQRWALLFDELEVAPPRIQKDIYSSTRGDGAAQILLKKLAIAPFNKQIEQKLDSLSPAGSHDFDTINLWYPKKEDGYSFSSAIAERILQPEVIEPESIKSILGISISEAGNEFDDPYLNPSSPVYLRFKRLIERDASFREYLARPRRGETKVVSMKDIVKLAPIERASIIRKVTNVAMVREYFMGGADGGASRLRSRKIAKIYAGYPALLAIAEGNPRMVIGIFSRLKVEFAKLRSASADKHIDFPMQARVISETVSVFRSLLRTIPYRHSHDQNERGVLQLLDRIGLAFRDGVVGNDFQPEPPLSFTVDEKVDLETREAIGRALNLGAVIFVPDRDDDEKISSLNGKRFRLHYLLAAYHGLPLIMGEPRNLTGLLQRVPLSINALQLSLGGL